MLYCKTCQGWFHGGCVPYKCEACTHKDKNKKGDKLHKLQEQLLNTKKDLDAAKVSATQSKKDLREKDNTIKALQKEAKALKSWKKKKGNSKK